jgi:hypothetical protein
MIMTIAAIVIADVIVTDLNVLVVAVGTTSIHETVSFIGADPAVVQ